MTGGGRERHQVLGLQRRPRAGGGHVHAGDRRGEDPVHRGLLSRGGPAPHGRRDPLRLT